MLLSALVAACARRALLVVGLALLVALGGAWAIQSRLGVTTDTGLLFDATLPWKQRSAALQHAFPQNEDLLVAAVDSAIPEEAEATARDLAAALAADTTHFSAVSRPDASPFLERNAFLFLDVKQLSAVLDQTIDAQPFLGQLTADPSLRGLASALSLIAQGVEVGQADLGPFQPALRGFHTALDAAANGTPKPVSWERLLAGPVADLAGRFHFVLAKPRLDFGALEPGAAASQALRAAAAKLEFVRDGTARVRLTGSVALDDEEFSTVAQGAVSGLIGSAVLVAVWLFAAVRTWRVVAPILLTLFLGLLLTAAFAALAVGTLNLVSVAFAILFIGIAVDFAIQFSVRMREAQLQADSLAAALRTTGRRAGGQILVASLATAAGFLAFTPTSFTGVAQLGLIAGGGMLIAFACTMTALPALLALFRPAGGAAETGLRVLRPLDAVARRLRWPIVGVFGLVGLLGLALLPHLAFDSDPLHTKNPHTEAMETLGDLMNDPVTSPYTMGVARPDHGRGRRPGETAGRPGQCRQRHLAAQLRAGKPGREAPADRGRGERAGHHARPTGANPARHGRGLAPGGAHDGHEADRHIAPAATRRPADRDHRRPRPAGRRTRPGASRRQYRHHPFPAAAARKAAQRVVREAGYGGGCAGRPSRRLDRPRWPAALAGDAQGQHPGQRRVASFRR